MYFCEFCKIFKNIFWQSTSEWLLLVLICEFWEVLQNLILRAPMANCLFHEQVPEFQPQDTAKNYFTSAFISSILYKSEK